MHIQDSPFDLASDFLQNQIFLAWAAAWIEAEGSIGLRKRVESYPGSFQTLIYVSQKDPAPLYILRDGFGVGRVKFNKNKVIWELHLSGLQVKLVLAHILPYMVVKRERANLVLRAQEIISRRYNRWHPRPQSEIDELWTIKNRIHEITGVSAETRQKQSVFGRSNAVHRWAKHYDQCVNCGTSEIKHKAHGLCSRCYINKLRKEQRARKQNQAKV